MSIFKKLPNNIEIIKWNEKLEHQAYELLNKYKESSLFLLANLKEHGSKLTDASYSANFKCLVKNNQVVAVFALTRTGTILVQTDRAYDYSEIIVSESLKEPISISGVIAEWDLAKQIWDYAKNKIFGFDKVFCKKTMLFSIRLNDLVYVKASFCIKYLEPQNYAEWNAINNALLLERNLNQNENETAKHKRFLGNIQHQYLFGVFINKQLIATASFISCVDKLGQIGDVFTIPAMRRQGLAKELVYQLLIDGKINKHLEEVVLFTGEDNHAAIKLYEGLGFKKIGYIGLLFKSSSG